MEESSNAAQPSKAAAPDTMAPDTWFNPEYNNKEPSWDFQATHTDHQVVQPRV